MHAQSLDKITSFTIKTHMHMYIGSKEMFVFSN